MYNRNIRLETKAQQLRHHTFDQQHKMELEKNHELD
jgi:hypothetical protein